jgi:hypothetical protein
LQQVLELVKSREGADVRSHVEAAIQPRGPTLLRILIAAITGALPEARLDEVSLLYTLTNRLRSVGPVTNTESEIEIVVRSITSVLVSRHLEGSRFGLQSI